MLQLYLDSWSGNLAIPVILLFSLAVVIALLKNGKSKRLSWFVGILVSGLSYSLCIAYIHSWKFYKGSIKDFPGWWTLMVFSLLILGFIMMSDALPRAENRFEYFAVISGFLSIIILGAGFLFAVIDVLLLVSIGIYFYILLGRDMTPWAWTASFLLLSASLFYLLLRIFMALNQTHIADFFRNIVEVNQFYIILISFLIITLILEFYLKRSRANHGAKSLPSLFILVCVLWNVVYMFLFALGVFNKAALMPLILSSILPGAFWIFGKKIMI